MLVVPHGTFVLLPQHAQQKLPSTQSAALRHKDKGSIRRNQHVWPRPIYILCSGVSNVLQWSVELYVYYHIRKRFQQKKPKTNTK